MKNNDFNLRNRRKKIFNFIIVILVLIFIKYFSIQVLNSDDYIRKSNENRFNKIDLDAPRGFILDRNKKIIVSNRNTFSVEISPLYFNENFNIKLFYDLILNAKKRSNIIINKSNLIDTVKKTKRYNSNNRINIINYIDFETKAKIEERKLDFPGLIFKQITSRYYPDTLRLSHILGYLRPITKELWDQKIGYAYNDTYGVDGIESKYEQKLRGKKGKEFRLVNTFGFDYGVDKTQNNIKAIPGEDIVLTIDYDLQLKIENLLNGYKGSIICMNPKNGEVLAMASAPDYSLKEFIGPLKHATWDKWENEKILMNRSTAGDYPPGSMYKLVSALMFLEMNLFSTEKFVFCDGSYEIEDFSNPGTPKIQTCWKKEGHGEIDLHNAIMQSCNVYFYDMMLKYQDLHTNIIDTLYNFATDLGFGNKTNINIYETAGRVPSSEWMNSKHSRKGWSRKGAMPNLSIGQGDNLVTPLQVINLINIIAMDGISFPPKLVKSSVTESKKINRIHNYTWNRIKESMYSVVNDAGGTAYQLKNNNHIIRGKTGTAQTTSQTSDKLISWFSGYVEKENNTMSLVVMIEDRNSDSKKISKIISKEIFEYYLAKDSNE